MAVVFDALSPQMTSDGGTSMSTTMSIGSGNNRALAVLISISSNESAFTVTWNGVPLTIIAGVASTTDEGTYIYGLLNPTSGTHTLAVSWGSSQSACAAGISFANVDQTNLAFAFTNANNSVGVTSPATITVTSAVGDIAIACQSAKLCTLTEDHTSIYHYVAVSGIGLTANRAAGAASVILAATQSVNQTWAASGVNVHAAANVAATMGGTATDAGTKFKRTIFYQTIAQPVFFTAPVTWSDQTNWPDFAPGRPRVLNFNPLAFVPDIDRYLLITDQTNWPDFAPGKPRLPLHQPWSFIPTPAQVFFPYAPWDDFARHKPQPLDTQPSAFVPVVVQAVQQVWYPTFPWPDILRAKQTIFDPPSAVFVLQQPDQTSISIADWPDFIPRKLQPLDTQPLSWVGQPIAVQQVWFPYDPWPSLIAKKPVPLNFTPATPFIQTPSQVFFPYGPWDDFARRQRPAIDTKWLAWSNFTPAPTFFFVPNNWPDYVRGRSVPLNFNSLAFLQTVTSPYTSFDQWPDFATTKRPPLNYIPLTFVQTIRTPWNELSRWPDMVPIRTKAGLHAALQQFAARFPGTIAQATITGILSAFEVNSDIASITILVRQSGPAVRAAVSIQEIGTI